MAANHHIGPTVSDPHHGLAEVSTEAQLLPPHLKFGMCASLVLASVFIAGAKYYFDHQGGGMDALIFCAFLTISFLALCAISLCRYVPRDLTASPSISVDGHSRILDGHVQHGSGRGTDQGGSGGHIAGSPHPQIYAQNAEQSGQDLQMSHSPITNSIAAPPPPYHIAILLPPESGKEMQLDESPPPSYDKILI